MDKKELKEYQLKLKYQNEELRESQEKLLQMRDKYHMLYEFAPISYFTLNKNGIIVNTNLEGAKLLKTDRNSLIDDAFVSFLDTKSQEKFYNHISSVIEKKNLQSIELVIKNKNDEEIYVLFNSSYVEKEKQIHSAVINITERVKAKNELEKNNKYIASIIESIPDMIFKINKKGEYIDIISYEDDLLYESKDKLIGKKINQIFDKKTSQLFMNKIKNALFKLEMQKIEYELEVKKGNYWFEARITPLNKEEVIVLIREISESKKREKMIKDYTAELEIKQMELENLYFKLDQEINKASKIHKRTLRCKDPETTKYGFNRYYLPTEDLGGDFYDLITKNNKLITYVSDVTGHGLEAAMMSSFIKSTINSYIESVSIEKIKPANITKFLAEQFLKEDYPDDYFICITLIVLDIENYEMEYIDLGIQDPILLYREESSQESSLHKLVNKGLPISPAFSFEMLDFNTNKIKLQKGDTLIFNTDGITEEKVNKKYFKDIYEKVFFKNAAYPAAIISKKIREEFFKFNEGKVHGSDDITYLIIKNEENINKKYHFEIKNTESAIKKFQKEIMDLLRKKKKNYIFAIGLHELVVNAMEHGNKKEKNKKVIIDLYIDDNYLYAEVEDEGEGFNWQKLFERKFDLSANSDRGRGIMMTLEVCDEFFYNEKGNKAYIFILQ